MIRSVNHMKRFAMVASDGRLGSLDDFYFDDQRWAIRHVVVDTGRRLPGIDRHQPASPHGDPHLRSASDVPGCVVRALDGDLGHVEDLLFEDVSWAIWYLVVGTSHRWDGTHVLVAPEWITDISWPERSVSVYVTRRLLKSAPQYHRAEHRDRPWEAAYGQHRQQPGFWLTEDDVRVIMDAPSHLRDAPDRHGTAVARRSQPR